MIFNNLGNTDIKVSEICLGSMTWGEQNSEKEAHEQINYALDQMINFIDTAEMYSVPGRKETQGNTEKIIGSWFQKTGRRSDVILATKITGPNPGLSYIRDKLDFSPIQLRKALEGSLKRLQTEYIDLYQLHWPERKTNFFGKLNYVHDYNDSWQNNFPEIIQTLNSFVKEGKIRHYGLSNETPWGVMKIIQEAEKLGLNKPVSIQNPYSLLNRSYEIGLSEISIREKIGLLAYSPLAFGVLTGKYLKTKLDNSRLILFPQFSRYNNEIALKATFEYKEIADQLNISSTTLSLAFVFQQDFVTSAIIGATSLTQLKENIDSHTFKITDDLREKLNEIHRSFPNPAP